MLIEGICGTHRRELLLRVCREVVGGVDNQASLVRRQLQQPAVNTGFISHLMHNLLTASNNGNIATTNTTTINTNTDNDNDIDIDINIDITTTKTAPTAPLAPTAPTRTSAAAPTTHRPDAPSYSTAAGSSFPDDTSLPSTTEPAHPPKTMRPAGSLCCC